jgi:hypothetical protein
MGLKIRHGIRGELKWRYFAPGNTDARNPLVRLSLEKRTRSEQISTEYCQRIPPSARSPASARQRQLTPCVPSIAKTIFITHHTSRSPSAFNTTYRISRRACRKEYGIIVGDHRGQQDDKRLRGHHQKLLHSTGEFISKYDHLIEGLFLEPSYLRAVPKTPTP